MALARRQPVRWRRPLEGRYRPRACSPTPQELDEAAPDHPVYVQQLYDLAVLNPRAMQALQISEATAIPPAGKVQLDGSGKPTGVIKADGNVATLAGLE